MKRMRKECYQFQIWFRIIYVIPILKQNVLYKFSCKKEDAIWQKRKRLCTNGICFSKDYRKTFSIRKDRLRIFYSVWYLAMTGRHFCSCTMPCMGLHIPIRMNCRLWHWIMRFIFQGKMILHFCLLVQSICTNISLH